jgi:molybdate transport system permease protein
MAFAMNAKWQGPGRDEPFFLGLVILGGFYVALILAMLFADVWYASLHVPEVLKTLFTDEIRYAIWLSLISCSMTAMMSLWVAVPVGYLLSRVEFRGKSLVDAILDVPIFLPPLVVGLSLLILFKLPVLHALNERYPIVFHPPAVVLAQFAVSSAFAVRTMRHTFDSISPRFEQVALTLGCRRSQAFFEVVIPQAWRGILTAGTLAWARSLGEFGPILVFAGSTRKRTEVLPVSVHLELSIGNIEGAVGVSLLMVIVAIVVLVLVRMLGGSERIW